MLFNFLRCSMKNDLMQFESFSLLVVFLLCTSTPSSSGQQTTVYVKRGETAELCDNRTTLIFAYEYRSLDGRKNLIVEPNKHDRYSNPHGTSLLRISKAIESDSGLYKCPQDDTEWQKLQVYVPVEHVYLSNQPQQDASSRMRSTDFCSIDDNHCLSMVEGDSLDVICAADGYPRPAVDVTLDRNGTMPTIMALASGKQVPSMINEQFKPNVYETYRIVGLTPEDNGRHVTCQVDMKQIDKKLIRSTSKQLYIEFRPVVAEKSKKIYVGINQTRTINCTVLRANPKYIRYSINGLSSAVQRRTHADQHDLFYTFEITPTSIEQFRPFNVTANNSIGSEACTYELIHGGVPDAINQCSVDTHTSNVTITISCTKSYAQGDNEGYACTLFKYNDKSGRKMFEEIARTKSCIFALENFHEPVEFRVAAFNRYGSLPVNTHGHTIRLNQPALPRETTMFNKKFFVILGSIFGSILLIFLLCCLCGSCNAGTSDRLKYPDKTDLNQKNQYPRSSTEIEDLKTDPDDTISRLVPKSADKRSHQNGTVYDIPSQLYNGSYPHPVSSTPINSAYHQQKPQHPNNKYHFNDDSLTTKSSLRPTRMRTANNQFYGKPIIDSRYGPISPTSMTVPRSKLSFDTDDHLENDRVRGDESPVYSTTTDLMSESGSFLVPSSVKRYAAPEPKPRYSTLSSARYPIDHLETTPIPLPKPRSRSNSRTRLNNPQSENSSWLYDERPASSSDSGIGQPDVVCLPNGDTIRTGLVRSGQTNMQKQNSSTSFLPQQPKYQTLTSTVVRGTEC